MASALRWFGLMMAFALVASACGSDDASSPPVDVGVDGPAVSADASSPAETGDADEDESVQVESVDEQPAEEADRAVLDEEELCGIWQLIAQYDDPNEMGEAIFGGGIDVEAMSPVRIAECLGFTSWRQQLIFEGVEGDGLPSMITVDTDVSIDGNTVSSHERYLLDGEVYEARAVGDTTWLRGPADDWFLIPDGDPARAILEIAEEHADTFGVFFNVGTLTGLGLLGSMVYGPLASPGELVEVDGVQATKWSVTPEAASEFAGSLGADLPPSFFDDARAEYWVTANGQVIKVDIALPAGITAGGAPDGSLLMRLYDFGERIIIAPPEN